MSHWLLPCTLVLLSFSTLVRAQAFIPPAIPLAVRSPYLNCWASTAGANLPSTNNTAFFWYNVDFTDWLGRIRVDGTTYQWLGDSKTNQNVTIARLVSTTITPTQTIQIIEAGPMNMTVTFLSPVEPSDWVKQSLSFSYLAVGAESTDGKAHSVQVYSEITAQWASSDAIPTVATNISFRDPGSYYYAMSRGENVTYKTCTDTVCQSNFTRFGTLAFVENNVTFRAIGDDMPVFAMSIDLGDIVSTQSSPVVWAVGYNHNPVIQYTVSNGEYQLRSPLFMATYPTVADAIVDFLSDFSDAQSRAVALDNRVQQAASQVTTDPGYYTMLSIATRQAFGSLSMTIDSNSIGSDWSISDVMIFMKNMGFDGGVNPVDKIYASFPNFLFFNASLGGPLLLPLLQIQFNNVSRPNYAATELGG
ncbi:uncharacterized protein FIBRA_07050 [Fibroporia radiculosa]|uniref:DUF5127 domain-containing protein n=1 Tax=Fibroporia radiculosa TaxID=599839 RepID=J4I028_9APHY|nr:uncharacterized protein FIBRA_07050 [Fibroporia radiculosa]CCM04857.1 predicted protein [Fibroporia radiculosa]